MAAEEIVCRICFDGSSAEHPLASPCECKGTQGQVHEACLARWRRLQILLNKPLKASRCEICGAKYAAALDVPGKPFTAVAYEVFFLILQTMLAVLYSISLPCLSVFTVAGGWLLGPFGLIGIAVIFAVFLSCLVLWLHSKGLKLSLLGSEPRQMRLGLTVFGPPVEGLTSGMLLVAIQAGGIFRRTVLYVMEHSDAGSVAVILNKPLDEESLPTGGPSCHVSTRQGGPLLLQRSLFIHNIEGVPGSERIHRHEVYLSRNQSLPSLLRCSVTSESTAAHVLVLKGLASWGERQLDGEVRSGAWGWISPADVKAEDLLPEVGEGQWERLLRSPYLQIFQP